jgi:hypothetical protein
MKTIIALIFFTIILYACSKIPELKDNRTADNYLAQVNMLPSTTKQDVRTAFGKVFNDFKTGATDANIRALYAEKFYFNDTIKIIENIDELIEYMLESAQHVNSTQVEILDVIKGSDDYFIRWSMIMDMNIKGKDINSHSIGMSQLRFDNHGKIIFHQDFWDSSEAFYEHLPYFGRLVKKIKSML